MSNKSTFFPTLSCCISQCRNYKNPYAKIDLYPLPEDIVQREKCCEILGIPLLIGLSPSARVCALHFRSKVGNYRPPPPSYTQSQIPQQASSPQSLYPQQTSTVMVDDGRRLYKPVLPKMQTVSFPTPSQQPFSNLLAFQQPLTVQQPITLTFTPVSNVQQTASPKEPSNDTNTRKDKSIDHFAKLDNKACDSSDVTLQLECDEDLLSTTQLNCYMKDLMDFVNASELVHRLPPPEPISSVPTPNNSESNEIPPLEPLMKSTSVLNNPATLSSSSPNSEFIHVISPSTKGVGVVSSPLTMLKDAVNNLSKPVTTLSPSSSIQSFANTLLRSVAATNTSSSSLPLFANSPILTPRTVVNTVSDKNPTFISVNGKQFGSLSIGANLSSNGLISQYGQTSTIATSTTAANVKLNSTVVVSSSSTSQPQTFSISSSGNLLSNLSSQTNSLNASVAPKNSSGIQSNQVFQILPEKYKIVNALSNNTAIPMMLLKAVDSSDVGQQSFLNNISTSSGSSSPIIVGREPDETEPCAASLCDVTLSESSEQLPLSLEQTTFTNDQSSMLNQIKKLRVLLSFHVSEDGSSSEKFPPNADVEESLLCTKEMGSSNNNINGQIGPVIVDVISAKEGATEFFNADQIPNILLDKSKKPEDSNYTSLTSELDTSTKQAGQNTTPKIYSILSDKDSIFSLQKSIPVIKNGDYKCTEPLNMFKIQTPTPARRAEEAENLRRRLQQENYVSWSVWWLIQRRYIPVVHPCNFCGSKKFIVEKNDAFPDGYCWTCGNEGCPVQKPIKRPAFFERFKTYSIQELLLLTYHWACQSSFEEITQDVDMEIDKIWCYFKALQELCHQVAVRKGRLGLARSSLVEVSVVKLGGVFILGAMDRKTRYVRLEAITEIEAYQSSRHIILLDKWVNKKVSLVSENKLPNSCLPEVFKLPASPNVTDPNSPEPHILNISKYLKKSMAHIFGSMDQHCLKTNDIQGFLYELQWRCKYGKFVDMSFWSILNHIRDLNVEEGSLVQVRKGSFSNVSPSMQLNSVLNVRWGSTVEDTEKVGSTISLDQTIPKMSGKDTKSYSKDVKDLDDYFNSMTDIIGGNAMYNPKSLLAIKIRFGETAADIDFYKSDAICLGLKLKSEGFISDPVKWLVRKGFVKNVSPCYVCQEKAYLKESSRFNDGCSWLCQNDKCKFENAFRRPSFFARYPQYSMSHIAGMIFHWIVQSDEYLINTDVPMDASKILDAWRSFQGYCSSALKRKREKIGGDKQIVEVSLVRFGKLFILGAWDRATKQCFLQAFPAETGKVDLLYTTLHSWIFPNSTIIIDATQLFQMHRRYEGFHFILPDTVIVDRNHPGCHVLNAQYYLIKHLNSMFCHIKATSIRHEVMQSYLDELMWREKYGKQPQQAFAWIMNEIFYHDLRYKYDDYLTVKRVPEFIPIKFKELRVVLRKIPKSVLKFYGCELPNSSKTSESPNSSLSEITEKDSSSSLIDDSDDLQVISDAVQCSSQRLTESDEEIIVIDDDLPSNKIPENKETMLEQSPSPGTSESTSSSTTSESFTNKVQPLVIKIHKKRKKFKSYLKSELEMEKKMELEKGHSSSASNIPNNILRSVLEDSKAYRSESPDTVSSDSSHSNTWETQSNDSTKLKNKKARKRSSSCSRSIQNEEMLTSLASDISLSNAWETQSTDSTNYYKETRKRAAASACLVQKEERPMCIECGEPVGVSLDHFMKQFNCTDCKKKSVYTTCCSKAFFEHRGSILFGKRMPRRKKEDYGLHRPIHLQSPWHCACGFSTKSGNKLASHMVKCRKRTCYFHQNVL